MSPHPAPAAIDALVALVKAAAGDVRVDDGPPVTDLDEPDAIGIGLDVEDVPAAASTVAYSVGSAEQPFDLACVAQSWSGDGEELPALRVRVFELLDIVAEVLVTNQDLGLPGVVWDAVIPAWSFQAVRGDQGAAAVLKFAVRVQAYR